MAWPEENEDGGYDEGTLWVCCSCELSQKIGTEETDPVSCSRCTGPACVSCRTDIDYCSKCERETRDEA